MAWESDDDQKTANNVSACVAALNGFAADKGTRGNVRFCRVPASGIQPQAAIDSRGTLHIVYYTGDPHHGDLHYARSEDGGANFSPALPVKMRVDSAISAGTIRGAQLALGKGGRVRRRLEWSEQQRSA